MKNDAEQLLLQKNIKVTANRLLVLDLFLQRDYALSLTDIENELPWADKTTLFRTLKTFQQKALLHLIDDGSKAHKYALCSDHCEIDRHLVHPHFHCQNCGKTLCLTRQDISVPVLPENYTVQSVSLIVNGLCSTCSSQQL